MDSAALLQGTKQNADEAGLDIVNKAGMVRGEHQKRENMNFHADNLAILTPARRALISSTRQAPVPRLAAALESLILHTALPAYAKRLWKADQFYD